MLRLREILSQANMWIIGFCAGSSVVRMDSVECRLTMARNKITFFLYLTPCTQCFGLRCFLHIQGRTVSKSLNLMSTNQLNKCHMQYCLFQYSPQHMPVRLVYRVCDVLLQLREGCRHRRNVHHILYESKSVKFGKTGPCNWLCTYNPLGCQPNNGGSLL